MSKPDAASRMVQWAVKLSQFDIKYRPRTTIKAHALTDFIVEFTNPTLIKKQSIGQFAQMARLL